MSAPPLASPPGDGWAAEEDDAWSARVGIIKTLRQMYFEIDDTPESASAILEATLAGETTKLGRLRERVLQTPHLRDALQLTDDAHTAVVVKTLCTKNQPLEFHAVYLEPCDPLPPRSRGPVPNTIWSFSHGVVLPVD